MSHSVELQEPKLGHSLLQSALGRCTLYALKTGWKLPRLVTSVVDWFSHSVCLFLYRRILKSRLNVPHDVTIGYEVRCLDVPFF